ncbi:hypothetical protein IWQ56_000629 [Coemansia nantahalensis]|nr:hypothetical protein IWQ56_000629 [Coemansia nantahalensis]
MGHTGHLGIGTVQGSSLTSAKDPEKLKALMSQVSATLDDESLFGGSAGSKRLAPPVSMGVAY